MKKIIHWGLSPNFGGTEVFIKNLVTSIPDISKYQIDFLIDRPNPKFENELKQLGCNFFQVTPRYKSNRQSKLDIYNVLKSGQYDILHIHLNSLSFITPIKQAMKLGMKIVVHSHNTGTSESLRTKFLDKLNRPYFYKHRNHFELLAVSELAGRWMYGKGANFKVVYNGINPERFTFSQMVRESFRDYLGLNNNTKAIVHVGAFRPEKNHEFIVNIAAAFKDNPNYRFYLIGDGRLKKKIFNLVKNKGLENQVIFAGNTEDVPKYLFATDIFILPSFHEGFPISLIEAQGAGLFCLTSDKVTNEVAFPGLFERVSLNNYKDWVRKIDLIKTDWNRFDAINIAIKKGITIDEMVKKVLQIY